jgi:16S rRNA (cytosine1402-N4)-methyltransferase
MKAYSHRPVMVNRVVRELVTRSDGVYVDGTVGTGGHSQAIAEMLTAKGCLICMDRDSEAARISEARLSCFGDKVIVVKANYAELDEVLGQRGYEKAHGVLLDLGMSSYQLDESCRGFSFQRDEPLDMRMDLDGETTAFQLVNELPAVGLAKILRDYGEEKKARIIAKSIEAQRNKTPIRSSLHLASLVQSVAPTHRPGAKHPATRVFQALRIAVNRELDHLKAFLEKIPNLIVQKGRLVILSYHSLEDRMVKTAMRKWEKGCDCPPDFPHCVCGQKPLFRRLHKKGLKPDEQEIEENPRARSAVMRVAERI